MKYFILTIILIICCGSQSVSTTNLQNYHKLVVNSNPGKPTCDTNKGTITRSYNKVTYAWKHYTKSGEHYDFEIYLDFYRGWQYMQNVYKKKNHDHGEYKKFVKEDPFSQDLDVVARVLRKVARNNQLSETSVALSFVQSFEYQDNMGGYQRYAVETLIDGRGDCSDTAVLYAGILKSWNYDCIFLYLPDHLAVGLWCSDDYLGNYYTHRGRRFYYCETTCPKWHIGEIPEKYDGTYATFEDVF